MPSEPDIFFLASQGEKIPIEHINRRDDFGRPVIFWAVAFGHLDLFWWMLDNGADYRATDYQGVDIIIAAHENIRLDISGFCELTDMLEEIIRERDRKK